jgi:hypothetical protein
MSKILAQKNFIRNALITIYILVVLGISATAHAQRTIYPIFTGHSQIQSQSYVGEIAMTVDHDFYLVVSEQEVYQLQSNVDLVDYNGRKVDVEGLELNKHKTGPVVETLSLDPLPGNERPSVNAPVLVVFGISELTN